MISISNEGRHQCKAFVAKRSASIRAGRNYLRIDQSRTTYQLYAPTMGALEPQGNGYAAAAGRRGAQHTLSRLEAPEEETAFAHLNLASSAGVLSTI